MHIVLIDDEKILSAKIKKKLEKCGYRVTLLGSYKEFLESSLENVNLFLIDISLWDGSWMNVLRILKDSTSHQNIPAIFVSAHDELQMKVQGLDLWWDDYVVKPFEFDELLARIRRTLRNVEKPRKEWTNTLTLGNISFDPGSMRVFLESEEVKLPKKEILILEYFLNNPDVCIKKADLYWRFWKHATEYSIADNTINVTICNLRKKLWDSLPLKTIVWVGYCLQTKL